jgi:hypothetical protein
VALYDYEFDLGKGRRLQGRGPLGLAALGFFLAAFVGGIALLVSGGADILRLISTLQKVL